MALACLLATVAATAQGATINGSVSFLGGVLGTWSVGFTASDPQIQLQKVVIQLPPTFGFDTQSGGFGLLTSQDFLKVSGGANVTGLTPANKAGRDGATALSIDFDGFNAAAGTFLFLIDVDGAPPTLATCASGLAGLACQASNAALIVASSTVDGTELAGGTATLIFGGPGYAPESILTTFSRSGALTADAAFDAVVAPEPSTCAFIGVGLAGLAWLRRRRT